jgi:hypothetical protein
VLARTGNYGPRARSEDLGDYTSRSGSNAALLTGGDACLNKARLGTNLSGNYQQFDIELPTRVGMAVPLQLVGITPLHRLQFGVAGVRVVTRSLQSEPLNHQVKTTAYHVRYCCSSASSSMVKKRILFSLWEESWCALHLRPQSVSGSAGQTAYAARSCINQHRRS